MTKEQVSPLLLERYRLNEVSRRERRSVEAALAQDPRLGKRLAGLEASDRELRLVAGQGLPPRLEGALSGRGASGAVANGPGRFRRTRPLRWGLAAAALLCVLGPSAYVFLNRSGAAGKRSYGELGERIKGTETAENRAELALYLKRNAGPSGEALPLTDGAELGEGDMVQLAYTAPAGEYYGVIFSLDGNAAVTPHYPYARGERPLLVPGKQTFLTEAYILDNAPDFEIFFMVVSARPLDTEDVLARAKKLTANAETAQAEGRAAFADCAVDSIVIRKK
jgi:hypothetical protein